MSLKSIRICGAREHNLKNVSLEIPRDKLVVITGLSGSGKSSLAFDTIFAEGQRKYVESLSAYARQFLQQMQKPDCDEIEGLPPTIAIEQRGGGSNPRSTVATTTEIYDYLRVLFARVGRPHCWICGLPIAAQSATQIVDNIMQWPEGQRIMIIAPLVRGQKGTQQEALAAMARQGFVRARVDGQVLEIKSVPPLDKNLKHTVEAVVDRLVIKPEIRTRLADSLELALKLADGLAVIAREEAGQWVDHVYSSRYACPNHPESSLEELSPRLFSFNSPYGACSECDGLGTILEFDEGLLVPDKTVGLLDGAIEPFHRNGKRMNIYYNHLLRRFCATFGVDGATPFADIPAKIRQILIHGTTAKDKKKYGAEFEGVLPNLQRRWENTESEFVKTRLHEYLSEQPCEKCHGDRLKPQALAVKIGKYNIRQMTALTITGAIELFDAMKFAGEQELIAAPILKEIRARLGFMNNVGLGYITLDRQTGTLSGGEAQRIRLATQVGSGLVGVCYVLDEPTIGLHQRDNDRLIRTLRHLTDIGNTTIVVEHDEDTMRAADWLIDVGPGAGSHGGRIIAQGPVPEVLAVPESITGKYLTGEYQIPVPKVRRKPDFKQALEITGAAENNLRSIDVRFPLGVMTCVTGVSGSGKSSLVNHILLKGLKRRLYGSKETPGRHKTIAGVENIDKVIEIDQSPIGRTPRSNPATYTGVFDLIRQLYAKTREARMRGYQIGRFSFNVKGGRCESCQGQGTKRIEMHFLPDVFVTCEECRGTRYNRETLEIKYRGKSIADVLAMRIEEALQFFDSFAHIRTFLQALQDVGLSYVQLGQSSTTLSGGEAQRVKLATELAKAATGHTLYVLDEPTTGLHFADIHNLLNVLNRLADAGNSVVIIEHNLDVIKCADWIIDLGPEGGGGGGQVVVTGTPEQVAAHPTSHTGRYLKHKLQPAPLAAAG
ncbi:MAG: excinuclease ABC subunit UvrA [Phycisphaerae bacterium]